MCSDTQTFGKIWSHGNDRDYRESNLPIFMGVNNYVRELSQFPFALQGRKARSGHELDECRIGFRPANGLDDHRLNRPTIQHGPS
jgi:hypothetical protein